MQTEKTTQQQGAPGVATEPELLDHEYDGIREYDNPTPGWWHLVFLGTIVFSALYFFITVFSPLYRDIEGQHAKAKQQALQRMFATMGELEPDTATFVRVMNDPDLLLVAQGVFEANCVSCHAKDGGGMIGPNLTDERWKNVRNIDEIYGVIANGAAAGSMPAWSRRLHQNEMVLLTGYVASLRGKPAATPRAAEGDIVIPAWPTSSDVAPSGSEPQAGSGAEAGANASADADARGALASVGGT